MKILQNKAMVAIPVILALALPVLAQEAVPFVPAVELARYWKADKPIAPEYAIAAVRMQLEGCYIGEYTIKPNGKISDAEIVLRDIAFIQKISSGFSRRGAVKRKHQALQDQESAVLHAIRAATYSPAQASEQPIAIRTKTLPIVISQLVLEKPDDPAAVAKARADHERRRNVLTQKCSG